MAHNLEIRDGKTSFVAVGEKAWHGLGTYVNEAMTAENAIKLARLDFEVVKKPIMVAGGTKIPGYWATQRRDTKDVLGIVTGMYEVIQNTDAFTFFDSIIDRGEAIYQTAGVLGKGERIFITAKLPEDISVKGDQIENYLLLTSGHDGKSAIQVGFTPIRVVCNNTLNAALGKLKNKVSISHFPSAKEKLKAASQIMGLSSKYTDGINDIFNRMAKVKITDFKLRQYIEEVMKTRREVIADQDMKDYSTRFTEKIDGIMSFAKEHDTQHTRAAKGTVWGAFNSITGYYNYIKNYDSQEEKMKDISFKAASQRVEKAFQLASQMI